MVSQEFADEEGTPLRGGNVSAVVRVGDTVRRSSGPWTPAVHDLLRFLESEGFAWSPHVLGIDTADREVLEYVEGEVGYYPLRPYMWADTVLDDVARALRCLHDTTLGFPARADAASWRDHPGPYGEPEVMCHTDWSPYNAVFREERFVSMIDWDFANPGSRVWDLAWVAITWIPLGDDEHAARVGWAHPPDRAARLNRLVDAYGFGPRRELLPAILARLDATAGWIERRAEQGDPAFARMVAEGHHDGYRRHRRFVEEHWQVLSDAAEY